MTQAKIPASIGDAIQSLNGISQLLTAKQWERAAIVYAFTEPGRRGGTQPINDGNPPFTVAAFAAFQITGLRTREQVSDYRKAWQSAMADGAPDVSPGDVIELPSLPWKEVFGEATPDVQERMARGYIRKTPDAISRIVRDEPALAVNVARQVMAAPAVRVAVESQMAPQLGERLVLPAPWTPPPADHGHDLVRAVNLLIPALRAMERGDWSPDPTQEMLLHFLGLLIDRAGTRSGEPVEDLFGEIERYLQEVVA